MYVWVYLDNVWVSSTQTQNSFGYLWVIPELPGPEVNPNRTRSKISKPKKLEPKRPDQTQPEYPHAQD